MLRFLKSGDYAMDDPEAYEKAYNSAKINKLEALNRQLAETQGRTLADYMKDESSLGQMAQNDQVKKMVIEEYLKELSGGGKPQVINDSTGNHPSAISSSKAGSIDEAAKMFKKMI